ncbi:polyketide biosynthesis malonyl-ACP decarboxylase PksF [Nocardiopsis terrae]|nr:polyketide biosynthesis malonyl-ACP decarboxylase PksF [Nocardiopsis terrae]
MVTGMAVLTALGDDLTVFGDALMAGDSGVRAVGRDGEGPPVADLGPFAPEEWADRFSGDESEVRALRPLMSRVARPTLTGASAALAAVRHARLEPGWGHDAALVVAGGGLAQRHQADVSGAYGRTGRLRASYALTALDVDAVGAISELTGVRGEGWTAGAASASGTVALIQAARAISAGWRERVLVVAPSADPAPADVEAMRRAGAHADGDPGLPPQLLCRPFDRRRRGFVRGEGAAAMVLESQKAAERRGVGALARISGHGQRLDARRGTRPEVRGQVEAMRAALDAAGASPRDVDYVNAHGTGSHVGDRVEAASLRAVFGTRSGPLLNSTKPLTGHCLSAAGLVEAVAVIAQMRVGACHPNPTLTDPVEPGLAWVGDQPVPHRIRAALSNSFAFGGLSASVVLRAVDGP